MSDVTHKTYPDRGQFHGVNASFPENVHQSQNSKLFEQSEVLHSGKLITDNVEKTISTSESQPFFELECPARYNEIIPLIAICVNAGLVCFLNTDTLELEQVSGKMIDNPEAFYASTDSGRKPFNHLLWNNCLMFEPLNDFDWQPVLDRFILQLTDQKFHVKLARVMKKRTSFAKINSYLNKSKHSTDWTAVRLSYIEKHVKERLSFLLYDCPGLF